VHLRHTGRRIACRRVARGHWLKLVPMAGCPSPRSTLGTRGCPKSPAAEGVKAHHWQFGNMPKIEAVTPGDVDQIVKYVRWLQRRAGMQ